jgi:very-short-patch-repair endonuclease
MKTSTFLARKLRRNQTKFEAKLWRALRNRKFHNLKFSRQKPIYANKFQGESRLFIIDFYCHKYKLAIEIDGEYHNDIRESDQARDEILKIYGHTVIRFSNQDVENNLDSVLKRIYNVIQELENKQI